MGLALEVDKLESVPESQRGWYEQKEGGKFALDLARVEIEDSAGLKTALEREKQNAKAAEKVRKELEARFAGIDPDKVREMMARFEGDEEGKLIAAGKIDEVVARRTEKLSKALQKQVDEAVVKEKAANDRAAKFSQRVLDNHIRAAAAKAGLHAHAIEDALFRARAMFSLNDAGDAVQLGADGHPVLGKDGKTSFTPGEWLESMKEVAPHWFPAGGSGGGAGGDKGAAGGGKTITRTQFDSMNPVERAKAVKDGVKVVDA